VNSKHTHEETDWWLTWLNVSCCQEITVSAVIITSSQAINFISAVVQVKLAISMVGTLTLWISSPLCGLFLTYLTLCVGFVAFSALTLLDGCLEGQLAGKNLTDEVLAWLSSGARCK